MSQTVIGIFDSPSGAQQAVEQLVANGFMRGNLDISSQALSNNSTVSGSAKDNDTHSSFFTSLFDDKNEANLYADRARRGSIVTVHAQSGQEAQMAAQLLDQFGAVDLTEEVKQQTTTTGSNLNNASDTDASAAIPVIEEELQVGKREVETGGVRLRSRIIERPVEEHLRLREEHLHIERHAVNRPASESDFATFKEGVIELTEQAEVPVVSKQARVVEEISLSKEVEEHTETIKDTVRSTDIEVENLSAGATAEARIDNLMAQEKDVNADDALLDKTHSGWQGTLRRMKQVEDDYKVADDDADVRGWNVMGNNGEKIGEVQEMIVDTDAMKVRYLDVEIENNLSTMEDNHILIPIGSVSLDRDNNNVIAANLNSASLSNYPAYNGETISRDYEHKVMSALSPSYQTGSISNDKFYDGEHFDTGGFSGANAKGV